LNNVGTVMTLKILGDVGIWNSHEPLGIRVRRL
jgi:hypothetical protein